MALIDTHAAGRLSEMRQDRGLSPEALSDELKRLAVQAGWGSRGAADGHTIRRIERHGHVPGERVRFVITAYFGLKPHELWERGNRVEIPS